MAEQADLDVVPISATNGSSELKKVESELKMDTLVSEACAEDIYPGKIFIDYSNNDIDLNKGQEAVLLSVTNLGDEPISIGSHYNFIEANKNLKFDRSAAFGLRLVRCKYDLRILAAFQKMKI
jgi:urease